MLFDIRFSFRIHGFKGQELQDSNLLFLIFVIRYSILDILSEFTGSWFVGLEGLETAFFSSSLVILFYAFAEHVHLNSLYGNTFAMHQPVFSLEAKGCKYINLL